MKATAAVLWALNEKWTIETVDIAPPGAGEVLVRIAATGLCHTDDHVVTGDLPAELPIVGGHEGSGVVEALGNGVTGVALGDHVVTAFNPPCGHCHYCASARSNLCMSAARRAGHAPKSPFSIRSRALAAVGSLGTFSEYTVVSEHSVIPIDPTVPLEVACLLGCAVTTGWGAAVYLAEVKPGDHVVVVGCGGVGMNSLQGARNAGADIVLAIDTNEFKRQRAPIFGATHTAETMADGARILARETGGRMADVAILSIGVGDGSILAEMVGLLGLGGRAVISSVSPIKATAAELPLARFTLSQQTLRGNIYGGVNVHRDIPLLLGLYKRGKLNLDDLITKTYSLAQINVGYADMHAGRNLRGVVVFDA